MIGLFVSSRRVLDVGCTVDVECTIDSFHAHVELDNELKIKPGDRVLVHGDPIEVPYGERTVLHRRATVIRANALEQVWTRITAHLELTELYDLSFTDRRDL